MSLKLLVVRGYLTETLNRSISDLTFILTERELASLQLEKLLILYQNQLLVRMTNWSDRDGWW